MKLWIFLFTFIMVAVTTWSQESFKLTGTILDESGLVLFGAHVALSPGDRLASTDEKGRFEFDKVDPDNYNLSVSYIGYQSVVREIVISKDTNIMIEMVSGQILTDEIVVEGLRATINTGTTYENIDQEEIRQYNTGQDLPYLLRMTPSMVVTSDAGHGVGYTGMRIRGSDASRINATINGIPFNDAESQSAYWVDLPDFASSIESIQIQRGVGTSTNGGGAFGASLNINTNALNPEPYIHLNNSAGSFNTWKNTIGLGSGLIDGRFVLDARLSRIKSDGFIDRAFADLKSMYLSGGWYEDRHILRFNIISGKETTYQAWNGIPEHILTTNRRYNEFTYPDQTDNYTQSHYQLHYSHQATSQINWSISANYTRGKGYYEEYKENQKLAEYGLAGLEIRDTVISRTNLVRRRWLDNHFYGLTGHVNWNPAEAFDFTFGGAFYQYRGNHFGEIIWAQYASDSFIHDRYYSNDALKNDGNTYLKATWAHNRLALFVDLQTRFLYYSFLGIDRKGDPLEQDVTLTFFNPKIGITYRTGSDAQYYASIAKGSREPNRDDYTEAPENQRPVPEELYDLEAGYRHSVPNHHFSANIYYMKYINQLVLNGEINDVGTYVRSNVKNSFRLGIEISDQYSLNPQWRIGGNIAWSMNRIPLYREYLDVYDGDFNFQGQKEIVYRNTTIAFSPSVVGALQLTWSPFDILNITWESKYVSSQYLDNTANVNRRIDPFSYSNIRFSLENGLFGMEEVMLALDLKNVFNARYETNGYTYGYIYEGSRSDFNYYYPQAGIHFMLSLNIKI